MIFFFSSIRLNVRNISAVPATVDPDGSAERISKDIDGQGENFQSSAEEHQPLLEEQTSHLRPPSEPSAAAPTNITTGGADSGPAPDDEQPAPKDVDTTEQVSGSPSGKPPRHLAPLVQLEPQPPAVDQPATMQVLQRLAALDAARAPAGKSSMGVSACCVSLL